MVILPRELDAADRNRFSARIRCAWGLHLYPNHLGKS